MFLRGSVPAALVNGWAAGSDMAPPRTGSCVVLLAGGQVLVAGGVKTGGGILFYTEIYDPAANAWTAGPVLPVTGRAGLAVAALADGKVLIAGRENASGLLSSVDIYDPKTNAFSAAPPLLKARKDHAAGNLRFAVWAPSPTDVGLTLELVVADSESQAAARFKDDPKVYTLTLTAAPTSTYVNTCSSAFSIERRADRALDTSGGTTLDLSTNGAGSFYLDSACSGATVTQAIILHGNGSVSFYCRPKSVGTGTHKVSMGSGSRIRLATVCKLRVTYERRLSAQ